MSNGIVILYRVCDSVPCVNGNRQFYKTKLDCIKSSASSLSKHIKDAVKMNIPVKMCCIYDHCSSSTIDFVNQVFSSTGAVIDTATTTVPGNVSSFRCSYEKAKSETGYILFLEDDYVFERPDENGQELATGIIDIMDFLNLFGSNQHVCIKPHHDVQDFIRDMKLKDGSIFKRMCFISSGRYWIQCQKSTKTFLVDDTILKKTASLFEQELSQDRLNGNFTNKIFERYPLFTPIKPIAEHMQTLDETVSPFFGGRRLKIPGPFRISL